MYARKLTRIAIDHVYCISYEAMYNVYLEMLTTVTKDPRT